MAGHDELNDEATGPMAGVGDPDVDIAPYAGPPDAPAGPGDALRGFGLFPLPVQGSGYPEMGAGPGIGL